MLLTAVIHTAMAVWSTHLLSPRHWSASNRDSCSSSTSLISNRTASTEAILRRFTRAAAHPTYQGWSRPPGDRRVPVVTSPAVTPDEPIPRP